MDVNFFCDEENCISEASAFYFKAAKQRKVCDAHIPIYGEKLYPIEQFYFVQSPEDETELLRRQEEVRQGKASLEKMLYLADDEQTAALALLEKNKVRAVQVICEVYEAEKRRTKQHFHQIEVFIQDFTQEFELYLRKKENRLSSPLSKLTTGLSGLCFLRAKTVENDLELAQVVMNSCSRGELSFDHYLTALLNPKLKLQIANQLFMLAKKSSLTNSYVELQQALANCTESEALNQLPEVILLKTFLRDRLDSMKAKRESELLDLVTRDPESIRSLLDLYLNNISIQQAAGEVLQVERLYEKALSFALPESQSKVTLDTLLSCAKWCTEQGQEKTRELKKVLKAALKILTAYYPNSQETMNTFLQLGKLYQQEGNYTAVLKHCQAAVAIGRAKFANSKETAEALTCLGTVYLLTNEDTYAEDYYEAALDILNASFNESSERAAVYANLGMLCEATKRFAEAEDKYKFSVDLLRTYFPDSRQLASTLTQIGRFYKSRGNTWEAERCQTEAYKISSLYNFQDLLDQLLGEGCKLAIDRDMQKPIAVLQDQVKCFDMAASEWQQLLSLRRNINVDFTSSSTFIPPNNIFVCGGGDAPCTCYVGHSAYVLKGDGSVQELPHLRTGRRAPGLTWDMVRQVLYVFGGADDSYTGTCYADLRTSEMFQSTWSPLTDMHQGRYCFNPCWYSSLVYLCGGCTDSIETYDPRSNTFALQDFTLPESDWTSAVVEGGVLTIISQNHISKLQQGRLTCRKHQYYKYPWSNCTPVVSRGVAYIVDLPKTCCCINLVTGDLHKEVSLN